MMKEKKKKERREKKEGRRKIKTIFGQAKIDHLKLTSNAEIARVAPATHAKITERARKLD